MTCEVMLFAALAEVAGARRITVDLADGATVADLLRSVWASKPALAPWRGKVAVAINRRYANPEDRVQTLDEIALIPPVSGG